MNNGSLQLLRLLEPAFRPGSAPAVDRPGKRPIESERFDRLLQDAMSGSISSGRQIQVPQEFHSLTALQCERLSAAADQAEALGAKRALMMIDGRALVIDIPSRTVVQELMQSESLEPAGVDIAMLVSEDAVSQIHLDARATSNKLLKALAMSAPDRGLQPR